VNGWSSQPARLHRPRLLAARPSVALPARQPEVRAAVWTAVLICVLVAEGVAVTHSYLWATPLVCLLFVAVAVDVPLVPFLGLTLLVRVLTDDVASRTSRHSASLDLSALIAGLFILVALGLLVRRRRGLWPAVAIGLWLLLWTGIATSGHGVSTLTAREGVREASIVAVALIVCNSRGSLNLASVTRLIQLAGIISALVAIYQLAIHSGQLVGGQIRSNGTFAQPNDAAVFFAIATMVSLWRFVDNGRRRLDALFAGIYAVATVTTFSLGGLGSLLVMLIAFGLLRPGSPRIKFGSCAVAVLIVAAFLATPLGAERIEQESSASLTSTQTRGTAKTSSLAWRLYKWQTLIPEWERAPLFGRGLGTTVTAEGTSEDTTAGNIPHNEYVRYLVETGAVGFILLLWGVGLLIRKLVWRRKLQTLDARDAGTLGIAIVAGLLVNALAANTLLYTPGAYAAALVVAAVLSSSTASSG
jgi:O-antigen ligase